MSLLVDFFLSLMLLDSRLPHTCRILTSKMNDVHVYALFLSRLSLRVLVIPRSPRGEVRRYGTQGQLLAKPPEYLFPVSTSRFREKLIPNERLPADPSALRDLLLLLSGSSPDAVRAGCELCRPPRVPPVRSYVQPTAPRLGLTNAYLVVQRIDKEPPSNPRCGQELCLFFFLQLGFFVKFSL